MHWPTRRHNGLALPVIATVGAVISIFSYVYYRNGLETIDLLWPPILVAIFSIPWGLERRLGFATLGSMSVVIAFGLAQYLRFPHSYVFTGRSYSGLGWAILGVVFLMCFAAGAFGFALGRWWGRKPAHVPGICGRCGYNLTGNQSGRCSECGEPITQEQQKLNSLKSRLSQQ